MARKHSLGSLIATQSTSENNKQSTPPTSLSGSYRSSGALGSVAKSLGSLRQKADEAAELENLLKSGNTVIELSPDLIETSFISDRMRGGEEAYQQLKEAIKDTGQLSPILVRPHPSKNGMYQTAYGHRRLRACRELGLNIKATVRELSNHDLIIAQGQENSARADLSYIERATFAHRLLEQDYDRTTIMKALSIDKTTLSRMLTVSQNVPPILIEWLGPCPNIGRPRWQELAENIREMKNKSSWDLLVANNNQSKDEEKFNEILKHIYTENGKSHFEKKPKARESQKINTPSWKSTDQVFTISLEEKKHSTNLVFKAGNKSDFASFVMNAVPSLYDDFKAQLDKEDKAEN
ncbi:plasmid partitioning protein RepB [Neokomagataea anthophila]|uniref:Plasmid partitioning protein RepB n=1 Tax=Neokomagataea anthophila TaxID=2826925 RepID=A0ABS5E9B4_9PROT|nr:plasmid partitioning protein RepB [Neokomagataea anthophila]MBR0560492.1 plasmid partitioning protein RepB [Neokomagataea anthophila]